MSYKLYGQYVGLGDASAIVGAITDITADPHLSEVVCHAIRLGKMERGEAPGLPCDKIPFKTAPGKGIGLRYLIVPVRFADAMREKPVLAVIGAASIVLGVFALGFAVGKATS